MAKSQKLHRLNEAKVKLSIGDWLTELDLQVFDEKENKTLFWATPINKGDKKFGALVIKCPSDNPLSSGMLNAITGFAMQTAIGISDSKMHENLDNIGASLDDVLMELQES